MLNFLSFLKFPVHFRTPTSVILTAFDKNNRKYDNISSLVPVWKISDSSLLEILTVSSETRQSFDEEKLDFQRNFLEILLFFILKFVFFFDFRCFYRKFFGKNRKNVC